MLDARRRLRPEVDGHADLRGTREARGAKQAAGETQRPERTLDECSHALVLPVPREAKTPGRLGRAQAPRTVAHRAYECLDVLGLELRAAAIHQLGEGLGRGAHA